MVKPKIQEYVNGFLFADGIFGWVNWVALIKKNKPDWQKGLLNGIGGHIEKGEEPLEAMIRKFKEETGFLQTEWRKFLVLDGLSWRVHFYTAHNYKSKIKLKQTTDEFVALYNIKTINQYETISNLKWIIPMALDKDKVVAHILEPDAWSNKILETKLWKN